MTHQHTGNNENSYRNSRRYKLSKIALAITSGLVLLVIIYIVFNSFEEYQIALSFGITDTHSVGTRILEEAFLLLPFPLILFMPALASFLWYGKKWLWGITMFLCGLLVGWVFFAALALIYIIENDVPK